MKIGAFVGKFYPPHVGHVSAVESSLKYCDKVIIVISKNKFRNESIYEKSGFKELDAELIQSWFREYFCSEPRVSVEIFDEDGLKPYPQDQDKWAEKFKKQFPSVNVKIADESYRQYNEKYFKEYEFMPIERNDIPIHSTMIRNNIQKYKEYIIPTATEYFKNIGLID